MKITFLGANHEVTGSCTLLEAAGRRRLIDCGIHPPTIYFPLVVHGAIMIEPTESENLEDLDAFIEAMRSIAELAETDADLLHASPTRTKVGRVDEVGAARKPVLTGDM